MEIIEKWAKDKNLRVQRKPGSYTSTYDLFTVEIAEMDSDGHLAMSGYDKHAMMNWLRDTPFEGRDPRGHVFYSSSKGRKYKVTVSRSRRSDTALAFRGRSSTWRLANL